MSSNFQTELFWQNPFQPSPFNSPFGPPENAASSVQTRATNKRRHPSHQQPSRALALSRGWSVPDPTCLPPSAKRVPSLSPLPCNNPMETRPPIVHTVAAVVPSDDSLSSAVSRVWALYHHPDAVEALMRFGIQLVPEHPLETLGAIEAQIHHILSQPYGLQLPCAPHETSSSPPLVAHFFTVAYARHAREQLEQFQASPTAREVMQSLACEEETRGVFSAARLCMQLLEEAGPTILTEWRTTRT